MKIIVGTAVNMNIVVRKNMNSKLRNLLPKSTTMLRITVV